MNIKKKLKEKGFTLIELLVVLAIIGILATLILSNLATARAKARDSQRKSDLKSMADALEMWSDDNAYVYPTTASTAVVEANSSSSVGVAVLSSSGKYLKQLPDDPKGTENYFYASDGDDFEIYAKLEAADDDDWYAVTSGFSGIVDLTGDENTNIWRYRSYYWSRFVI